MTKSLVISSRRDSTKSLGGKANGLYYLEEYGLLVPQFTVVPFETLHKIQNHEISIDEVCEEWINEVQPEKNSLWAVRSSAEVEDGEHKSYAGMFTTVTNCKPNDLPKALNQVLDGFMKAKHNQYHDGEDFQYHIVIQQMISGSLSGVGFSINPLDYESPNPLINVIPGQGDKLVSGEESAMILQISPENQAQVRSTEEMYCGELIVDGQPVTIQKSKSEIQVELQNHLGYIRKTLLDLEQAKGHPVDVEFTIANEELYWLQVRPVTNYVPKGDYTVWDNSNVAMNYPGVVMPITSSFVHYSYSNAYIRMSRFLGASDRFIEENYTLYKSMSGVINGAMYYNITSWQQLLYQLPFGKFSSKQIATMLGARSSKFSKPKQKASTWVYTKLVLNFLRSALLFNHFKKKYLEQYHRMMVWFEAQDFASKPHKELISDFRQLERGLAKHWWPPMLNGLFTMISYSGMKKWLLKSRIHLEHPNFLNDTLSGSGDVISVEIVHAMQTLLHATYHNKMALEIINQLPSDEVLNALKTQAPEIESAIRSYIASYGERCDEGELKIETVNYKEDPATFIEFLRNNLKVEPKLPSKSKASRYGEVINHHYRNPIKRWAIKKWVGITISLVRNRENFRFIRTVAFDKVRTIFRHMDRSLLEQGLISEKNDSQYLRLDELLNVEAHDQYKALIASRKEEYRSYENIAHHDRYYHVNGQFYPAPNAPIDIEGGNAGVGCSSGICEGEVVIVTKDNVNDINAQGKILVARFFEPGWIGLFSQAGGLIAERGSLLSHAAILCREMGVPAIMGATNILKTLKDGDRITMDGSTGQIETTT